jgi:hypothetical protein
MGYVEPVIERSGTGKSIKSVLAAYFVDPDGKQPMATLPSAVEASLTPQGGAPLTVNLSPKPQGNDAWAKARFASEPGDFSQDEIHGELKITVGGKTVPVKFSLR